MLQEQRLLLKRTNESEQLLNRYSKRETNVTNGELMRGSDVQLDRTNLTEA